MISLPHDIEQATRLTVNDSAEGTPHSAVPGSPSPLATPTDDDRVPDTEARQT